MVPQLFEQRKCNKYSAVLDCNRSSRAFAPDCLTPSRFFWNKESSRNFYMTSLIACYYARLATLSNRLHNIAKHKELSDMHSFMYD